MGTKKSKQPFTMVTDKYFTTNIHYKIKKLECDYILKSVNSNTIMLIFPLTIRQALV